MGEEVRCHVGEPRGGGHCECQPAKYVGASATRPRKGEGRDAPLRKVPDGHGQNRGPLRMASPPASLELRGHSLAGGGIDDQIRVGRGIAAQDRVQDIARVHNDRGVRADIEQPSGQRLGFQPADVRILVGLPDKNPRIDTPIVGKNQLSSTGPEDLFGDGCAQRAATQDQDALAT